MLEELPAGEDDNDAGLQRVREEAQFRAVLGKARRFLSATELAAVRAYLFVPAIAAVLSNSSALPSLQSPSKAALAPIFKVHYYCGGAHRVT